MLPSITPSQQTRADLNALMDFISTNEFIALPAAERQQYLQKLKELIKASLAGEE